MAKTNWQYNEIVKPEDMNAMGQEINEALQKARGAIPATEKGQANGVAKLDANGKVLDGSGNVIDGQVRSINGRKGDVTINANDVGLANVQNYGIASQAEAEQGSVNNKYMTPLRTKQLVDKFAETPAGAQAKANQAEANAKAASVAKTGDKMTGDLTIQRINPGIAFDNTDPTYETKDFKIINYEGSLAIQKRIGSTWIKTWTFNYDTEEINVKGNKVWHEGNDGPGSGLDADTVDGVHAASLVQTSRKINVGAGLTGGGDLSADRTISVSFGGSGSATTVARSDHTHGTATSSANGFMSAADKAKLDGIQSGAEVNQNAFSNVRVGSTTISADSKTDILELVAGSNIILTPDATNDKITIAANVPVTSVNGKTGAVNLTAADVGAETPAGAQAKADNAETRAKEYFMSAGIGVQAIWYDISLINGVQPYTSQSRPRFCKIGNIVFLIGSVKNITGPITIGYLPEGYRPIVIDHVYIQNTSMLSTTQATFARWVIGTDGAIRIEAVGGGATFQADKWFPINTCFVADLTFG